VDSGKAGKSRLGAIPAIAVTGLGVALDVVFMALAS
jgi:hypothetical protein